MTKKNEVVAKPKNDLAVIDFSADAGVGLEDVGREERELPYLVVLQDGSPQCKKTEDKYRADAEPGMLLNTATDELLVNPIIIPLSRDKCYSEQVPTGEGDKYTNLRHDETSDVVRQTLEAGNRNDAGWLLTPGGNKICKTIYLNALLLTAPNTLDAEPVVLVLRRSKLSNWKSFMDPIDRFSNKFPFFAHQRVVTTELKTYPKASTFVFSFDFVERAEDNSLRGNVEASLIQDPKLYELARDSAEFLKSALASGAVKLAEEVAEVEDVTQNVATPSGKSPF